MLDTAPRGERARSPPEARFGGSTDQQQKKHGRKREYDMQSSERNIERFGPAVEEVQNILAEYERCCAEQVEEAEAKAQGDVSRFAEVCEQLTRERRKLADLEEERERLPFEAYTAGMGGDSDRESELRARYASITPEDLEALRRSCGELEAEKNRLGGTSRGAERRAHGTALEAYGSVLVDLERFEDQIAGLKEAVKEARVPFSNGKHRVEEHLQFLRQIEREERREARVEAARSEEARRGGRPGSRV